MNKKNSKEKPINRIQVGERRIPKKKSEQQNPFSRIQLHPLEELEGRDEELELRNKPEETSLDILDDDETTSITSTPSYTSTPSTFQHKKPNNKQKVNNTKDTTHNADKLEQLDVLAQPLSPIRDFQKIPNSVTREALPAGLFRGKSKQVWDYLWSVSRGSYNPTRIIRKSRKEIMKAAGIGSMVTVDAALLHLELTGLLRKVSAIGSSIGNEYEIFTPEEVTLLSQISPYSTSTSSTPSNTSPIQKMVHLVEPLSGTSSTTQVLQNIDSYESPKTLFKTKRENDDDEAQQRFAPLAGLRETFEEVFIELTGKGIEQTDATALQEIAKLLANELRAARLNTKSISKPAAFLAQHLKTRLAAPARFPLAAPARFPKAAPVKPDTIGKPADQQGEAPQPIDLSIYTSEELFEFEKEFCLRCGNRHDECGCTTLRPA